MLTNKSTSVFTEKNVYHTYETLAKSHSIVPSLKMAFDKNLIYLEIGAASNIFVVSKINIDQVHREIVSQRLFIMWTTKCNTTSAMRFSFQSLAHACIQCALQGVQVQVQWCWSVLINAFNQVAFNHLVFSSL